jgi:predicted transcriptional regulator
LNYDIADILEQIGRLETRGPLPAFTKVHVIYAIQIIRSHGTIGRKRLAELLSLGEGSVRTMLQRLRGLGLVTPAKGGYSLSDKGMQLDSYLRSRMTSLMELKIAMPWRSPHNVAAVVKGAAGHVTTGIPLRDASIRLGAAEALVLTYDREGLHMPRIANLSKERPEFAKQILETLKPEEGDVIIIAGADDAVASRYAALGAALTLIFPSAQSQAKLL